VNDDVSSSARVRGHDELAQGDLGQTELEAVRPAPVSAAPLSHGTVLAGRYEVQKVIGRGGMGLVVRAHDRVLSEVVAIKIVRGEYASEPEWTERLAREVKLARQIQHPNVCRVFDFGQADGRVFLVMELASEGTLRSEISAGTVAKRPFAERIADARAIAAGLSAIHAAGIVHRDVSPQNLLRMEDGRLVVSDFGLATDSCENTTSVHGGTIAYMAPEVVRGGRASFASDVWALGVVIHEAVFGKKPRWRDAAGLAMLPPGPQLTAPERGVLEVCRACAAPDPARRLARAGDVVARLSDGRLRRQGLRRRLVPLAALAGVAALAVGLIATARHWRPSRTESRVAAPPLVVVVPTGEAADWTGKARLLADLDQRFHCAVALPDRRTVRLVWGEPRRAEDVDTQTGIRRPAPLAPEVYAEGCPDVSPDGRRIVYPGHTPERRAFAFVSERADGSGGKPVVATAEPSLYSEPTWLPDGMSFSYDIDFRHMGVFSLVTQRTTVLPEPTTEPHASAFRFVTGNRVFVSAWLDASATHITGFSWPALAEEIRLRVPTMVADWRSVPGTAVDGLVFYAPLQSQPPGEVVAMELGARRARRLGSLGDGVIDRLMFVDGGLAMVTSRLITRFEIADRHGRFGQVNRRATIVGGTRCGPGSLLTSETSPSGYVIVRLGAEGGGQPTRLTDGPFDIAPSCSADGSVWFYSRFGPAPGLQRCDESGCRVFVPGSVWGSAVSPDGRQVAFVAAGARGIGVSLIPFAGGEAREVAQTETICGPGWSRDGKLWVSRRLGNRLVWTEIDPDSAEETGRIAPGSTDCMDAWADPVRPDSDARTFIGRKSQLRLVPRRELGPI
jgi:hypothetical protein